jgi:beta-glucosidase/6-phospho-beta-glucosidase/beta-galactosidase
MRDFPDDFLFGSSTAAHQVEGGNVSNDWWAWEHAAIKDGTARARHENGIATADDEERVAYLRTHLAPVARALADGIDVRSFHYWSSFDNFDGRRDIAPPSG